MSCRLLGAAERPTRCTPLHALRDHPAILATPVPLYSLSLGPVQAETRGARPRPSLYSWAPEGNRPEIRQEGGGLLLGPAFLRAAPCGRAPETRARSGRSSPGTGVPKSARRGGCLSAAVALSPLSRLPVALADWTLREDGGAGKQGKVLAVDRRAGTLL